MNKDATLLQRLRSTATDELGDEERDDNPVDVICEVQQEEATEPGAAGEAGVTTWYITLPTGTEVRTGDALIGVTGAGDEDYGDFEFIGDPWDARQGSQDMWHVEAKARQTRAPDVGAS